jgi:hypothetical protein
MSTDRTGPEGNGASSKELGKTKDITLDAALAYAAQGLPVFPLRPDGKAPAIRSAHKDKKVQRECKGTCGQDGHGVYDATTDPDKIRAWWTANPEYGIGIRTGQASGLVVVDLDGPDGETSWTKLEQSHGPFPPTKEIKTGGGRHLYFQAPGPGVEVLTRRSEYLLPWGPDEPNAEGVDVRGEAGYVLAPPALTGCRPTTWTRHRSRAGWSFRSARPRPRRRPSPTTWTPPACSSWPASARP